MFVFGGSFNPVHLGHLHIIHKIIEHYNLPGKGEKVLLVPSFIPPFEEKEKNLLDFDVRYKLLSLAIEDYKDIYSELEAECIELSDIEKQYGKKMFTSVLLEKLKSEFSLCGRICFIAGDDILVSLFRWHDVQYIKQNIKFVIYSRTQAAKTNVFNGKKEGFCIEYLEGPILDISSSKIRSSGDLKMLSLRCREYLKNSGL